MEEKTNKNGFWEIIKVAVISLAIVIPIRTYIAQPFIVEGESMHPTFENGEYLIVDELSYRLHPPSRGEVIVFRYPLQPSEFFIKRIIGLPGETVKVENGSVVIKNKDGQPVILDESYLPKSLKTSPDSSVTLNSDQYFVMGDNRPRSSDSRIWGAVPKENITGHVLLRLWPIARASVIN